MAKTWTQTVSDELHAEAERLRDEAPPDTVGLGRQSAGQALADSLDRVARSFSRYTVTASGQAEGGE